MVHIRRVWSILVDANRCSRGNDAKCVMVDWWLFSGSAVNDTEGENGVEWKREGDGGGEGGERARERRARGRSECNVYFEG